MSVRMSSSVCLDSVKDNTARANFSTILNQIYDHCKDYDLDLRAHLYQHTVKLEILTWK